MSYIVLEGFPKGVDARKFALAATPGTLADLTNGHLTNGAEIEKRKAFVEAQDLSAITETGGTATAGLSIFGLQRTSTGLMVFGSALPFGITATLSQPVLSAATTGIFTYQQLQHPAVADGETYVESNHRMTAVVFSRNSGAGIFVLATFADGNTFGFYTAQTQQKATVSRATTSNVATLEIGPHPFHVGTKIDVTGLTGYTVTGAYISAVTATSISYANVHADEGTTADTTGTVTAYMPLVRDFTDGLIMAHLNTNDKIATAIAEMINRSQDYTATVATNVATITGPLGLVYDLSATDASPNGVLTALKTSDPTAAVAARQAVGSFEVVAGSSLPGTNKVTKVEVNGVTITNGAVDWTTSNEITAGLLAAGINAATSSPDYTAVATGATVAIYALAAAGATPNDFVVQVTAAGDVCIGRSQFQIQVVTAFNVTHCYINGEEAFVGPGSPIATGTAFATATAIANAINTGPKNGTYLANATGAIISISKKVTASSDANVPIYFVTDAAANSGNGIFDVGSGTGSVSSMTVILSVTGSSSRSLPGQGIRLIKFYLNVAVLGGLPPYLAPVWGGGVAVTALGGNSYVTAESVLYPGQAALPPHVYCVVTDSTGQPVQSNTL